MPVPADAALYTARKFAWSNGSAAPWWAERAEVVNDHSGRRSGRLRVPIPPAGRRNQLLGAASDGPQVERTDLVEAGAGNSGGSVSGPKTIGFGRFCRHFGAGSAIKPVVRRAGSTPIGALTF